MSLTLTERFLRGLELSPERPAVRIGTDTITYRQAHEKALRWSEALLADGPPGPVGVLAGQSMTAYMGLLAVLYSGGIVVPLQSDFPPELLRRMIKLAGLDRMIADENGLEILPKIIDQETLIRVLATDSSADRFPIIPMVPQPGNPAPAKVALSSQAYILFTSGSTGIPKGVRLSHAGFAHYFDQLYRRCDLVPDDVFAQTFNLNFDSGINNVFSAWGVGATVQVVPTSAYLDFPAFLADHRITVWYSTPSAIWLAREMGGLGKGALDGLRWTFFAGEALHCQDALNWQAAAPRSTIENNYGPTELNGVAWHWLSSESGRRGFNGTVPIGIVDDAHEFRLVTEQGEQSSMEGELWVTGPQIAMGYLNPADEEDRFVELEGRRWYRTGDRIRANTDGDLSFIGRLDSQVKVHGWRVELAEVDQAVRECDGVRDAVTVTMPAKHGIELVVFYAGDEIPQQALADGARAVLPDAVLPYRYVHLTAFPLNPNRKVDRLALQKRAAELSGQHPALRAKTEYRDC